MRYSIFLRYLKYSFGSDLKSSITIFVVSLPLCLGIASLCGAPSEAGIISGFSGGVVTGAISASSISVSGPSAGYAAILSGALGSLQSYQTLLTAIVLAGCFQILFGLLKLGRIAYYIPSSVVNGLLVAIGVILILKQVPSMLGTNPVPTGDLNLDIAQKNGIISAIANALIHIDIGSFLIGISCLLIMFTLSNYSRFSKITKVLPASLIAVSLAIIVNFWFSSLPSDNILKLTEYQLVNVPSSDFGIIHSIKSIVKFPNFFAIDQNLIKISLLIALVVSIEGLLGITAADKMDSRKRHTSANRELVAQGVGNIFSGMFGGIPVTSVVVRTSVNINSGAKTKMSSIMSGIFLITALIFIPQYMNKVPFSCLSAILIYSGFKIIKDSKIFNIIKKGKQYYMPFFLTVIFIVCTDLLMGVCVGFSIGILFVLRENYVKAFNYNQYKHYYGEVLKIDLPQEISFLNTPSIVYMFESIPRDSKVIINASSTKYIDHDALDEIKNFIKYTSRARKIKVSTVGFDEHLGIDNRAKFSFSANKKVQNDMKASEVLEILKEGNKRFASGDSIGHDYKMQMLQTASFQSPVAVIISCIDSRAIPEAIFDLGIGDAFIIRIAGNIVNKDIIGSVEFGCNLSGAKLVFILGHTACGAINAAYSGMEFANLTPILQNIDRSVSFCKERHEFCNFNEEKMIYEVTKENIMNAKRDIMESSEILREMVSLGKIQIATGIYNILTGVVDFQD